VHTVLNCSPPGTHFIQHLIHHPTVTLDIIIIIIMKLYTKYTKNVFRSYTKQRIINVKPKHSITDLFKLSFLHVKLIELLLTILELFQQMLIEILQLMILLLLVIRLQRQPSREDKTDLITNIKQSPVSVT